MISTKYRVHITTLVLLGLIAACTTEPLPTHHQKQYTDVKPVMKEQTTLFKQQVMSGAAYAGAEYAPVLAPRRTLIDESSNPSDRGMIPTNTAEAVKQALERQSPMEGNTQKIPAILSIYERQSWSRFCGQGKMSEADVRYIGQVGAHQLPDDFRNGCNDIALSVDGYLGAWKKRCAGSKDLSDEERMLLERTTKPKSMKCG